MVELSSRRIEVHRQRIGLHEEGLRGVNPSPASVEEAVGRLREVEGRSAHFHNLERSKKTSEAGELDTKDEEKEGVYISKAARLEKIKQHEKERKLYKEGRLTHRSETELKTHTSYLVFAVLPREWSDEDEKAALERWGSGVEVLEGKGKGRCKGDRGGMMSRRQMKKALRVSAGVEIDAA